MEENIRLVINEVTQRKIDKVQNAYEKGNLSQKEKAIATRLVDEVLAELFETPYSFLVPMDFLNSSIGTMLMSVKYSYEYYYGTFDIQILCDKARTSIYYSSDVGKFSLLNKGGSYVATESEVRKLMASYKWSKKEIDRRFRAFWTVKSKHEKKILKKDFEAEFKKILKDRESV